MTKDFCINSLCPSCDKCPWLLDCFPDYFDQCPDERWWEDEWGEEVVNPTRTNAREEKA